MSVSVLAGERYVSLITYKRDGTPVATTVWVVSDDGRRLLVWTGANTWKARRLRRNPRVLVAAADGRGRAKGAAVPGRARFLEAADGEVVRTLLRRKYRFQMRGLDWFNAFMRKVTRRPAGASVYFEIVDLDESQQHV